MSHRPSEGLEAWCLAPSACLAPKNYICNTKATGHWRSRVNLKYTWDCIAIIMTIIFFCFFLQSASESSQSFIRIGRIMLKLESNPVWVDKLPLSELRITMSMSDSSVNSSESDRTIKGMICCKLNGWVPIDCIIIITIIESNVEFASESVSKSGNIEENWLSVSTLQSKIIIYIRLSA